MRGSQSKGWLHPLVFPRGHDEPRRPPQLRSPAGLRTLPRVHDADTPPHAFNKSESIVEPVWSPQTQQDVSNVAVLTYRRLPRKNGCSKIFSSIVRMSRP